MDAQRLSPQAEAELLEQARNGCQRSRESLVLANQGLVHAIARRYWNAGITGDLAYEDVVQLGNVGLLRAIDKWRPDTGAKRFSTYAVLWIRAVIWREGLQTGANVTLSYRNQVRALGVKRARRRLTNRNRREPTAQEVASETGLPAKFIETCLDMEKRPPLRLDWEKPDDSGLSPIHESIPGSGDTASEAERRVILEQIQEAVERLDATERCVITMRYFDSRTYRDTAAACGVTTETVKVIERRALTKIRVRIRA